MKKKALGILTVCGLLAGLFLEPTIAGRGYGGGKATSTPVLSQVEINELLFMREEEKLAHDVYITLYSIWGRRVFDNISQSEQRHMDAILGLLDAYGLDDPVLGFGMFEDATLQELYENLIAQGDLSLLDALYVGAAIEEIDIIDLVEAMERTDRPDILNVYGNLMAGSENHLNAFVRNIERITGEPYVAQYLSQDEVDAILDR